MRPCVTRHRLALAACLLALPSVLRALPASALAVTVGEAAPAFALKDTHGKTVKLSDFKGRHVVLEWTNPGCPFVQKHYSSRNMQDLQKEYTGKDVVWLTISSTAKDTSDYLEPSALHDKYKRWGSAATALLLDDSGSVGKAYSARTTPHLYVINPAGALIYAGGIDDRRSADPADVKSANNFVKAALAESLAGKTVTTGTATPYGCSVRYAR
ncbi:thioredoxin family protein [Methylibium sp.]|uniref:thioredoxin family protein n=1 Tax=Methylibium sp. TaxID=2067992 RepID=UPI003D0C0C3E